MLKQLLKGSAIVGTAILATLFFEYIYQIFMAHHLIPSEFGILNVSLSVLGILTILITYGIGLSLAKFISEDTETERVKKYVYNSLAFVLLLSIVTSLLLLAISAILQKTRASDLSQPFIIVAIVLPVFVLSMLATNIFQGLERMTELGLTSIIIAGVKVIAAVALVYLGYGLLGALISFLFGSIFALIFAISRLKKYMGLSKLDFSIIKKIINYSLPVSIIVILFTIILKSDSILLKYMSVPNQFIGFYMGSALVSRVVFYLSQAVAIALLPMLSSKKIKPHILKRPTLLLVLLMSLSVIISSMYKRQIISLLFPEAFASVSYVLPLLLLAMSTLGISYIVVTIPIGTGRPDVGVRTSILGFLVYLASFFILVPRYSIVGSALSILFGALAVLVSTTLILKTSGPSTTERIHQ